VAQSRSTGAQHEGQVTELEQTRCEANNFSGRRVDLRMRAHAER
jgi:hypothetical protein